MSDIPGYPKIDNGYEHNMEYHPDYSVTTVTKKVAAFGAVAYLLSQAVLGAEYAVDVEQDTEDTIYTLRIPKWAELSGQSQVSLDALISHADLYTKAEDAVYNVHTFRLVAEE